MIPGVDHQSPTWRALKKHLEASIAALQIHLEAPNESDYTNILRGQIKGFRILIDTVEPSAPKNNETKGPFY